MQINCIIIMFYISFEYQGRLESYNTTEVTTHTGQNDHLFFCSETVTQE